MDARTVINKAMSEGNQTLQSFLSKTKPKSTSKNEWVTFEDAEVYVRISQRFMDGKRVGSIEVANVTRESRSDNVEYNPNVKSTGFMRRLYDIVEDYAENYSLVVYAESVLNEFLPGWLERRGYHRVSMSNPPSYYKFFG